MAKIAVVNRTNLKNYGSVLQCYALCEAVAQMGYDSEIVWEQGNLSKHFDFRPVKLAKTALKLLCHPGLLKSTMKNVRDAASKEVRPETAVAFDRFVEKWVRQRLFAHRELVKAAHSDEYAKFICGSDQIWCSTTLYVDPLMYLRFAPAHKRVAYAPSIGRNYIPNYNRRQMRKYINAIPSVSIREDEGQRLIRELTGREVPVVLDPTLLLKKEKWEAMAEPVDQEKPYVLSYFLDMPSVEMQRKILETAKNENLRIVSIGRDFEIKDPQVDVQSPVCGPGEFIGYVSGAQQVFTDSYHGMLFSLMFRRQFWSVERAYQQFDQSSRQMTVLERLDLQHRYITSPDDVKPGQICYDAVEEKLQVLRQESLKYLRDALRA